MKSFVTFVIMFAFMFTSVNAQSDDLPTYPKVDGVVAAEVTFFTNGLADLGDPNYIFTYLYEFDTEEPAEAAMPLTREHIEALLIAEEAEYGADANPVIETEIGTPGDDQ